MGFEPGAPEWTAEMITITPCQYPNVKLFSILFASSRAVARAESRSCLNVFFSLFFYPISFSIYTSFMVASHVLCLVSWSVT